ncbi:protein NOXP20 isoform X2 [Thalassophryne amazonica]|uniref:protein NOXP20 isoform X2 n=1 Tax=Thalassophryne amazonica TaxID=390379 RepID=UPI001470EF1D|nr:protein NOXP20 isoform X2 [Thalassophryne amazonica]
MYFQTWPQWRELSCEFLIFVRVTRRPADVAGRGGAGRVGSGAAGIKRIIMSQAGPIDIETTASETPSPLHGSPSEPGSCDDVPEAPLPPSDAVQPPLSPEVLNFPQSTEETENTIEIDTSKAPPDQLKAVAEDQLVECDQPVSLEQDTEAAEEERERSPQEKERGWGGWGSWGKFLSNATSSVGQSLNSVKVKAEEALHLHRTSVGEEAQESVEAAGEKREEGGESTEAEPFDSRDSPVSAAAPSRGVFSTITHAVQNTGKSVISGGLDALEFIGKKTMTVLAESDPGFKKTKTLMHKTASLSQILKEAKEKERARLSTQPVSRPTAHYSILFDDYQGLSHLEALEILSIESETKVQEFLSSLVEEEQEDMKKELILIKEIFIREETEEEEGEGGQSKDNATDGETFVSVLTELLFELHVAATPDKLNKARMRAHEWVSKVQPPVTTETADKDLPGREVSSAENKKEQEKDGEEQGKETDHRSVEAVYLSSVGSLAEVTARSIEQLHKVAELILHGQELEKPAREQAHILSRLTSAMCKEVDYLAKTFSDTLLLVGAQRKAEELNPLIDNVLLEGANSTNYIHNAFQLLLPILQISHIHSQHSRAATQTAAQTQH